MSVDLIQMKNTISQSEESEVILTTFISEFIYSIRKEFSKSKNEFSTGSYAKCFQKLLKSILDNPESLNQAQDGFNTSSIVWLTCNTNILATSPSVLKFCP